MNSTITPVQMIAKSAPADRKSLSKLCSDTAEMIRNIFERLDKTEKHLRGEST